MPRRVATRLLAVAVAGAVASLGLLNPAAAAPPSGNQVINPQATQGPRGPLDAVPAGSVAYVDDGGLTIVTPSADGGGSLAIYDAAPGRGGGQALLDGMKAKGTVSPGISVRSTPTGTAATTGAADAAGVTPAFATPPGTAQPATECSSGYGAAKYWATSSSCAVKVRWAWNGFSHPQVYYHDHTPAYWPVHTAVNVWNQAYGIDSWWTGGSCPGGGRHCVEVWNAAYNTDWYGYTYERFDSNGYFVDGTVAVFLNDYNPLPGGAQMTVCHELGHTLGLGHDFSYVYPGCMEPDSHEGIFSTPAQNDYDTLANVIY